MDLIIYIKI